jgi:hypothetical protein
MYAPDPVLTASIYAASRLDGVLREGIAPFLRMVEECTPGIWGAWFVRYTRGGEHLKLRLHGPVGSVSDMKIELAEKVCSLWARLPPPPEGDARTARPDVPPVDADDDTEAVYSDRTLRWTVYRRSPVSLGPAPFLEDDGYVARLVGVLAAGSVRALAALEGPEPPAPAVRQRELLRLLVEGLAVLPMGYEKRAAYLAYHRDWLLRFTADDPEREAVARAALEAQGQRMAGAVEQLRGAVDGAWTDGVPATAPGGFPAELRALHAYLERFRGDRAYDVDPFAPDPAFPPLFKAFHGFANQLGLHPLEEAFAHHLCLLGAARGAPAGVGV